MTKKIKLTIYIALYAILFSICMGMGIFALTNVNVQNYLNVNYTVTDAVLDKSLFKTAASGKTTIYFDYYDDNTFSTYTIAGGVQFR